MKPGIQRGRREGEEGRGKKGGREGSGREGEGGTRDEIYTDDAPSWRDVG